MMNIKGIILTNKSRKEENVLSFYVNPSRNKFQIKNDVIDLIKTILPKDEKNVNLKIEKIRTINYKPSLKVNKKTGKMRLKGKKGNKRKKAFVKFSKEFDIKKIFE